MSRLFGTEDLRQYCLTEPAIRAEGIEMAKEDDPSRPSMWFHFAEMAKEHVREHVGYPVIFELRIEWLSCLEMRRDFLREAAACS